jgi:prepilin-type N-terminal cleavage/methylation domain-containing protein
MKKAIFLKRQRGDTIVEVMIVLAVLGLAFAISYATANRGVLQARNAEEHSEALGILDGQVEELRAAFSQNDPHLTPTPPTEYFCMDVSTGAYTGFGSNTVPPSDEQDSFTEYPNGADDPDTPQTGSCQQTPESFPYYVSISYAQPTPTLPGYYDLLVRWDGVGDLGPQQEELTYKLTATSLSSTGLSFLGGSGGGGGGGPSRYWNSQVTGITGLPNCVATDTSDPISADGCFPDPNNSTDIFALRDVNIGYPFQETAATGSIITGSGTQYYVVVSYNEYPWDSGPGVPPSYTDPSGYSYQLNICLPSPTAPTCYGGTYNLPGNNNTPGYQGCTVIALPAGLGTIGGQPAVQFNWINNNDPNGSGDYWNPATGIDPNLEISSVDAQEWSAPIANPNSLCL